MALCDLFVHPPALTFSVNLLIYLYLLFLKLFRFRLLVGFRIFFHFLLWQENVTD